MDEFETIGVDVTDGIATVTFRDRANRNALRLQTTTELFEAATALAEHSAVRCIVLTHEGDFFCTGADLSEFAGDESDPAYVRHLAGHLHAAIAQFRQAGVPLVGAVDGIAAGAGFSLTLVPHLLLLGEDAQLTYAYPDVGLTGDGGSTTLLPRLVGLRTAYEIVLLNEPIGPERAEDLGLATEVVPSDEFDTRVADVASRIAAGPTHALAATTRLMTESYTRGLSDQLAAEVDAIAGAMRTEDYRRGLDAFFEGEDPEFVGR